MVGDFKLNCTTGYERMYGGGRYLSNLDFGGKNQIEEEKIDHILMPRIKIFLNKLFFCKI
jgi:hypothetical protein